MKMALELAFESLQRALTELQEAVSALHVTITEDRPSRGVTMLVDQVECTVTDLIGTLEEIHARTGDAIRDNESGGSQDRARRALCDVHGLLNRVTAQYMTELATHGQVERLLEMGRERGREWRAWSEEVRTAIGRCTTPMIAVANALMACWTEQADRMLRGSVSVQATSIGQQITVREDKLKLAVNAT
jgi:hypothetical protein